MDSKPLVSVFLMTYNHGKYVKQSIESILMQKVDFDYEIVVGDDCSSDDTPSIITAYDEKFPGKFKLLFNKVNLGAVKNQNQIFSHCDGKYIAMLEGDDYWTDSLKLQKQVDLLEKYQETSMSVSLVAKQNIFSNEMIFQKDYQSRNYPLVYFSDMGNYFHTSTYLIRTSILHQLLGKYEMLFRGDTALRYLLIHEGPFVVLNEHVSIYRANEHGTWTSKTDSQRNVMHYQLYNVLRKKHVPQYRKHYARMELRYLHKVINSDRKNTSLEKINNSYWELGKLIFRYDILYPLKQIVASVKNYKPAT